MAQIPIFSNGLELANLVMTSDPLLHSWATIQELYINISPNEPSSLPFYIKVKPYPPPHNYTIIAFVTSPTSSRHHLQRGDLASSANLKEIFPPFEFLCNKGNPSFSIHKAAITLFAALYDELSLLKNQLGNSTSLIITGHSLGGSIASLFTLWLLESMSPLNAKRPLCITFGSPLIGDNGLREVVLQRSKWSSCFLHVASNQDPIPRPFISPHDPQFVDSISQTSVYKPFGTFLLCSELGCACFEDPESILELLVAMALESDGSKDPNEGSRVVDYGCILEQLKHRALLKGISGLGEGITSQLQAGIVTQLEAIGVETTQQQNIRNNPIIAKIERWEVSSIMQKRKDFDSLKKLNNVKINMANLEWYKKRCKARGIGYYDSYKNRGSTPDLDAIRFKKILTNYWKDEVERMVHKEGASFQTRWLYGGTNYRRMVEPLHIADYYKEQDSRDYISNGRSQHYILLEKWQKDEEKRSDPHNVNKLNIASSQTEDSRFWAFVEEAIISCTLLMSKETSREEKESSRASLIEFEHYAIDLIGKYAVSPEIFLEKSSFMQWWIDYEKIIGTSYNSPFVDFMKNHNYKQYA